MSDGALLAAGLALSACASYVAGGMAGAEGVADRVLHGFTVLLLGSALLAIMAVLGALILKAAGVA